MFKEYINKNCIVVVGFAIGSVQGGGSSTAEYHGILLDENEEYLIIDTLYINSTSALGKFKSILGKTYINKRYIIALNFAE